MKKFNYMDRLQDIFLETKEELTSRNAIMSRHDHDEFLEGWYDKICEENLTKEDIAAFYEGSLKELNAFWDNTYDWAKNFDVLPKENQAKLLTDLGDFFEKNNLLEEGAKDAIRVSCEMDEYTDLNVLFEEQNGNLYIPNDSNEWAVLEGLSYMKAQNYLQGGGKMIYLSGPAIPEGEVEEAIKTAFKTENHKTLEYEPTRE